MATRFASVVIRASVVAAAFGSLMWTHGSILGAQAAPGEATATPPKFDVATVKRNVSGASEIGTVFQPDGHYRAFNVRLRDLVSEAYRVRGFQVVGGPQWVASERFDIEAKTEDPSPKPGMCEGIRRTPGRFMARTATMAQLATSLSILLQRPVIDRTGIAEPFDFDLEWAPVASNADAAATAVSEFAPSLLAALDEQLGLKLDAQRAPIEYIVIDTAAPPTDN